MGEGFQNFQLSQIQFSEYFFKGHTLGLQGAVLGWWEAAFLFLFWSTVNSDFSICLAHIRLQHFACTSSAFSSSPWLSGSLGCVPACLQAGCLPIPQPQSLIPAPITLSKGLLGMGGQAGPRQEPVVLPGESHGQRSWRAASVGAQRVRHDWATSTRYFHVSHPVFWHTVFIFF